MILEEPFSIPENSTPQLWTFVNKAGVWVKYFYFTILSDMTTFTCKAALTVCWQRQYEVWVVYVYDHW